MPLFLASLNSGSNGNCYYIGNGADAVLIDAGISCRETERRMARLGLEMSRVRAIFISHEHTDHTRGAERISHKHGIPVYITDATRRNGRLMLRNELSVHFPGNIPIAAGTLEVFPFPKWHDAAEPHSFLVRSGGLTAGVFTDIGIACDHVAAGLSQCHAAFLESNYDEEMLEKGWYPKQLKRRIRGAEGHLSNDQALDLFRTHRPPWMQLLILSHLSAINNRPELALDLFRSHAGSVRIEVASRHHETEVFCVG